MSSDNDFFVELQGDFLAESGFMLEQYEESMIQLEKSMDPSVELATIFRVAHSIKGGAAAVGLPELAQFAHVVEDLLDVLRAKPAVINPEAISLLLQSGDEFKNRVRTLQRGEQTPWDTVDLVERLKALTAQFTQQENAAAKSAARDSSGGGATTDSSVQRSKSIKVDVSRIDSLLDVVGELVVLKNQLLHHDLFREKTNPQLQALVDQIDTTVRDLHEKALGICMVPLKAMFVKVQRVVRDVSLLVDKPVELSILGEDTEVERMVFEVLADPLLHLVRNSLDHGIESREVRQERGKPETAQLVVAAHQAGGHVIIDITDDGGGISREKILSKAYERGLVPDDMDPAGLSNDQVLQFIFHPGFSTADKITDLSGRGVGLDVVKANLESIHGKISISTTPGHGSTFRLTIPLSTAVTDGLVVSLDGTRYILPLHAICEIVQVPTTEYTHVVGRGKVARIRDSLIPVIEGFSSPGFKDLLVVLESVTGRMAFPVDQVLGQAQVVVKPLVTGQCIPEVAGVAILGDGRTVLILDPTALMTFAREQKAAA